MEAFFILIALSIISNVYSITYYTSVGTRSSLGGDIIAAIVVPIVVVVSIALVIIVCCIIKRGNRRRTGALPLAAQMAMNQHQNPYAPPNFNQGQPNYNQPPPYAQTPVNSTLPPSYSSVGVARQSTAVTINK
ncbi:unnamed protein product [Adineta steineri]|uniref:Uncharacterized protein n=1 Tax=Adineta steineri TaxID=433720 RepID=A0A813S6L2_9BILA|nr:unnamed protein product [Adineta steineri]CAF0893943.1 unnamed protein product [Adineta steineri]